MLQTVDDFELADRAAANAEARLAAGWHGGWLAAMILAAIPLAADIQGPLPWALAAAATPGAAGLALLRWREPAYKAALIALWAVGAAVAVVLSGGLAGPLAVWTLTPLAAASLLGGRRLLAAAAALSAGIAAAVSLTQAGGYAPLPAAADPWISLFGLGAFALALAAALAIAQRVDLGGRQRSEAARRRLAFMLDGHPLALILTDREGGVLEVHGHLPDGVSREEVARGLPTLAHDPAVVHGGLEQAFSEGRADVNFQPAGARDRWYVVTMARYRQGVVAVLRDASLERAREAGLEQAAADAESLNAGKSRFLANMSHELRTPLNAIIGFSDIMRTQMFGPISAKYAEYSGLIHESGGHLLDLINDVLDMSKIEAHRFELSREMFDARDAVSAALRLMRVQADTAKVQLRGVLPQAPVEVAADRRAIKQIVLNLVSNALKFTTSGGSVTVTLRAAGDDLELVVADTGVGISAADLERIGKPYEQAGGSDQKAQGTGLGLSLVRAFAELHGGEMSLESAVGEGTAVTVRLPVMMPAAPEQAPPAPATPSEPSVGGNVVAFTPQR